eukprot:m.60904 g.60904  ORF g.60904 m.60904 type:complete len:156 (+) comp9531_c0_seq2:106-573(+)
MFRYIALLVVSIVAAVTGNESTCGPTRPSPVPFCDKPDMGSCGNACCVVDVELPSKPDDVYATTHSWLKSEGTDRSFTYVTGPNKVTTVFGPHRAVPNVMTTTVPPPRRDKTQEMIFARTTLAGSGSSRAPTRPPKATLTPSISTFRKAKAVLAR